MHAYQTRPPHPALTRGIPARIVRLPVPKTEAPDRQKPRDETENDFLVMNFRPDLLFEPNGD